MNPVLADLADDFARTAEQLACAIPTRRRRLRFGLLAGVAGLAVAGGAAAATGVWTPQVGDGSGPSLISRSAPPQEELDALAVLRRPQTRADRGAESTYSLRFQGAHGKVRIGYVRLLGMRRGHGGYVLIPVEGGTTNITGRKQPRDQLCLSARDGGGTGVRCFSLHDVMTGQAVMGFIPGPRKTKAQIAKLEATLAAIQRRHPTWKLPHYRQPHGQPRWFGLVPDDVKTVQLGTGPAAPTTAVRDNFFEFTGPAARRSAPLHYLDATGHEILRHPARR
jgi:hypothetical protein